MAYKPVAQPRADRYPLSVDEYVSYQSEGFLVVKGLVPKDEVDDLRGHGMDILFGRTQVEGVPEPPPDAEMEELINRFSRIHMLHRADGMSERMMLHPRVLDVLEGLIGPDVLALQTMLFLNPPGRGGQGWHQDAYYITTYPDTLIGVWLALDRADEENGCVWISPGSHNEPIYPDTLGGSMIHAHGAIADLGFIENASMMDDSVNTLAPRVAGHGVPIPVVVDPGDAFFFHGHVLHRSYPNKSPDRWRRSFVSHYCSARSWVPWNHGAGFDGDAANYMHILARGRTHLPYSLPKYGTSCAALDQAREHPESAAAPAGTDGSVVALNRDLERTAR